MANNTKKGMNGERQHMRRMARRPQRSLCISPSPPSLCLREAQRQVLAVLDDQTLSPEGSAL